MALWILALLVVSSRSKSSKASESFRLRITRELLRAWLASGRQAGTRAYQRLNRTFGNKLFTEQYVYVYVCMCLYVRPQGSQVSLCNCTTAAPSATTRPERAVSCAGRPAGVVPPLPPAPPLFSVPVFPVFPIQQRKSKAGDQSHLLGSAGGRTNAYRHKGNAI